MKLEDNIDEYYVPTEEDFTPKVVDEKEELFQSIKKSARAYSILYCVQSIVIMIVGAVQEMIWADSTKLYEYPIAALFGISALYWAYYAFIHYRIFRAKTAQEMLDQAKRISGNSLSSKAALSVLALCLMAIAALAMYGRCHWSVILLAVIGIAALCYGFWWLFKDYSNQLEKDIAKLQSME